VHGNGDGHHGSHHDRVGVQTSRTGNTIRAGMVIEAEAVATVATKPVIVTTIINPAPAP